MWVFFCLGGLERFFQESTHSLLIPTVFRTPLARPDYQHRFQTALCRLRALRFLHNKGSVLSGFSASSGVSAACEAG